MDFLFGHLYGGEQVPLFSHDQKMLRSRGSSLPSFVITSRPSTSGSVASKEGETAEEKSNGKKRLHQTEIAGKDCLDRQEETYETPPEISTSSTLSKAENRFGGLESVFPWNQDIGPDFAIHSSKRARSGQSDGSQVLMARSERNSSRNSQTSVLELLRGMSPGPGPSRTPSTPSSIASASLLAVRRAWRQTAYRAALGDDGLQWADIGLVSRGGHQVREEEL
jgi:hypothetical protein